MKSPKPLSFVALKSVALATALVLSGSVFADALPPLVDSFDDATNNDLGLPRQLMTDSVAGGQSTATHSVDAGVVVVKGDITPARGQLGWASFVLPLDGQGQPQDADAYEGVLLKVKLNKGNLSVSVNSTEVTNFDFHASPVTVTNDGEFHEVKVPFDSLKRAWSEQTPLNAATVNAISIVAYGVQPESFNFVLDEVSFY
ncbi:CIA30 family protein [Gilvimarinus sp. SDUM040013]|uniref:CIA30 family protein n=1 Tax=Gilvimarinus gilvus TaxID=3058038 RepID=A0ABU4S3L7_9GAMM|nr:CIA30 family protein [Gilvimarinus sp. SDUM040013]MDO3384779.1 CIA30 family protein [Gilvimarinus sp. SDUM040013]MDX6850403.1 CIA30 family protein [Gilvimarinus sp. SDUM040013]